jgi:hypothetical protein
MGLPATPPSENGAWRGGFITVKSCQITCYDFARSPHRHPAIAADPRLIWSQRMSENRLHCADASNNVVTGPFGGR